MKTKYALAKELGMSISHITEVLNGEEYASLPTAVEIEIKTGGQIKTESIVRPEVAKALREFLKLRCPFIDIKSLEKEEEVVSKREERQANRVP